MKKLTTLFILLALTAGTAFAQSNDSIERQKQQDALLKQQQNEQQELQKQQQKEQMKQQKTEAKQVAKEQERKDKRASWGRNAHLSLDLFVGSTCAMPLIGDDNIYSAAGANLGLDVNYHYPIGKRWDVSVGLGYRATLLSYEYATKCVDAEGTALGTFPEAGYWSASPTVTIHTFQVPIRLAYVSKKDKELFLGVNLGYNFSSSFTLERILPADNSVSTSQSVANPTMLNRFRCDLVIGIQTRRGLFLPGCEIYFNLAPTYIEGVETEGRIHEFGVRLAL